MISSLQPQVFSCIGWRLEAGLTILFPVSAFGDSGKGCYWFCGFFCRASPLSSSHSLKKLAADFRASPPTTLKSNSSGKSIQGIGERPAQILFLPTFVTFSSVLCGCFSLLIYIFFSSATESEADPEAVGKEGSSGESIVGKLLEGTNPTKWHAELHKVVRSRQKSVTTYSSHSESERADFG